MRTTTAAELLHTNPAPFLRCHWNRPFFRLKQLAPIAFFWSKAPSAVCVLIRSDRRLSLWLLRGGVVSTWPCCCGLWTPRSRLSGVIAPQTTNSMLPLTYLRLFARTDVATRFTGAVCCRFGLQSTADVFAFLFVFVCGVCSSRVCAGC
jgi:hypothetical protein